MENKAMAVYIALLRKEKKSAFGVSFPDFPGCITAGRTLDEARKRAPEALKFHIKGMIEDGESVPKPSSVDEIMADSANKRAVHFLVSVPDPKAKRINITIPGNVLEEIDAAAHKLGLSRSTFLVKAAQKAMTGKSPKVKKAVRSRPAASAS